MSDGNANNVTITDQSQSSSWANEPSTSSENPMFHMNELSSITSCDGNICSETISTMDQAMALFNYAVDPDAPSEILGINLDYPQASPNSDSTSPSIINDDAKLLSEDVDDVKLACFSASVNSNNADCDIEVLNIFETKVSYKPTLVTKATQIKPRRADKSVQTISVRSTSFKMNQGTKSTQTFKPKNSKCNVCQRVFKTAKYLAEHYKKVHKEYKQFMCTEPSCGKGFIHKFKLKQHEKEHLNARPYRCEFPGCDKSFGYKGTLEEHVMRHSAVRLFECSFPYCGKRFKTKGPLRIHERIHTGVKPYSCHFFGCDQAFSRKSDLNVHITTHTGVRPFACDFESCGKTFITRSLLGRHQQTHSSEVFVCPEPSCRKKYNQPHNLRQHMKKKHMP